MHWGTFRRLEASAAQQPSPPRRCLQENPRPAPHTQGSGMPSQIATVWWKHLHLFRGTFSDLVSLERWRGPSYNTQGTKQSGKKKKKRNTEKKLRRGAFVIVIRIDPTGGGTLCFCTSHSRTWRLLPLWGPASSCSDSLMVDLLQNAKIRVRNWPQISVVPEIEWSWYRWLGWLALQT